MKPITYYLSRQMTEDIEAVLTNLSWEKKFELSVALAQTALDEKHEQESRDRVQTLDWIEPPEKTNEPPT